MRKEGDRPSTTAKLTLMKDANTKALAAIRSFCFACQGRSAARVSACDDADCPLHAYRQGGEEMLDKAPLRAVRRYCLVCCGGERREARSCAAREGCALWSYRFGVSPCVYRRVKARFFTPQQFTLPGFPK